MRERFGLRLRVAAFFAALGLGGALIVAAALWFGWQRAGGPAAGYLTAGLIAGFGIVGLSAWIGFLFDENVARPILGLSNDLDARAATEVDADVNQTPGRYLGRLAPAVGAVHQALNEARAERDAAVAAETARIERDRTLLSALIRDMAQAVMVVSDEGRILLFNDAAVRLLGPLSLDRPLHRFMLIEPFAHRLGAGESDERVANFLSSSLADDQLITGKISAFGAADGLIGHLIVCDAATEHLRGQAASDRAVAQLLEKVRRPTMNLGAMLDVMGEGEELTTRMRGEVASLGSAVVAASTDMNTAAGRAWPRQRVLASDILGPASGDVSAEAQRLVLSCDRHFFSHLAGRIAHRVEEGGARRGLRWSVSEPESGQARLALTWEGESFRQAELDAVLATPLTAPYHLHSTADILAAHDADVFLTRHNRLLLDIPRSTDLEELPCGGRGGFDFPDTFEGQKGLRDLSFVVFDTETTGLDPEKDDVIQIAGVRLLRGAILDDDFDQFVDPERRIPPSSTDIHGITDAMVAGAPKFSEVGRAFKDYTENAFLVAHNARFDGAFLDRLARQGGPRFDSRMLCTARLSQALDPQINDHTLDAVADRYGIAVDSAARHTALGDAHATARVFQKMLPILEARSVASLDQALEFQGAL